MRVCKKESRRLRPRRLGKIREALGHALEENARLRQALARAEEELRDCDERFKTVLDQSIDVAYRRNLKLDCYDYLSPAIETITGYTVAEFSRVRSDELLSFIHPDDHPAVLKRFEDFEASRRGTKIMDLFEYRLKCKNGGYRWIADSGVLVFDSEGTPLYHVGVARDITQRKQFEDELQNNNEKLERAVADRTERLQRLAVELTLAEQRERRRLSDFLHDDLQQVLVAAKFSALNLAADVKDDALRSGAGKVNALLEDAIKKTRSLCSELVTPLLYVVGLVPALSQLVGQMDERYGLQVEFDVQDLPDFPQDAVRAQLFSAVRELLFNVVKHAGTKRAHLQGWFAEGRVELRISDGGKGFDPDAVMKSSQRHGGCGLFSISERIAAMKGQMSVTSAPGCGTCVAISFPLEAGPEAAAAQPLRCASVNEAPLSRAAGRARVLVADDHDLVRSGVSNLIALEPSLNVVCEVSNGHEVLAGVRQLSPDVVVMDVRMPDMGGLEATRRIKAEFPGVIVIGMSAFVEEGFRTEMVNAGAVDLLDKAEVGRQLLPLISRCLAVRRTSP